jgi:hypothetical protein
MTLICFTLPQYNTARCYIVCTNTRLMTGVMISGPVNARSVDLVLNVVLIFKRKKFQQMISYENKCKLNSTVGTTILNKDDLDIHIWSKALSILDQVILKNESWYVCQFAEIFLQVSKLNDLEHFVVCLSAGFTFLFAGLRLCAPVSCHCLRLVYVVGWTSKMQVSLSCLQCTFFYLICLPERTLEEQKLRNKLNKAVSVFPLSKWLCWCML